MLLNDIEDLYKDQSWCEAASPFYTRLSYFALQSFKRRFNYCPAESFLYVLTTFNHDPSIQQSDHRVHVVFIGRTTFPFEWMDDGF